MMAVVGSEAAFDLGRQQLELLAGLHVSTKSVERQAEKIGAEIMRLEQAEIQHSVQLQLPIPLGPPIPCMSKSTPRAFPVVLIVDFYHASEHVHTLSRWLFPV